MGGFWIDKHTMTVVPGPEKLPTFSLAVSGGILGALAILPRNWRAGINNLTTYILAVGSYVAAAENRDVAVGKLASFIDRLVETEQYGCRHIISYSMGTLIALDSLIGRGSQELGEHLRAHRFAVFQFP